MKSQAQLTSPPLHVFLVCTISKSGLDIYSYALVRILLYNYTCDICMTLVMVIVVIVARLFLSKLLVTDRCFNVLYSAVISLFV